MVNFYEKLPNKYLDDEIDYPNKKQVNMKLPSIVNLTGPTGSGKSNCVFDLIKEIGAFNMFYLFAKSFDEPLYRWFIDKMENLEKLHDITLLIKSNNIQDLPPLDEIDKKKNNLFIIDDMIGEKDKLLQELSQYAIRGRKRNASFWFLGQDYFKIPGLFRKQQNYVVLTGINTWEDLKRIMREMAISIPAEVLVEMYKEVQNLDTFEPKPLDNYFMIDNVLNNPLTKCRFRLQPIDPRPYYAKLGLRIPDVKDGKLVVPREKEKPKEKKVKTKKRKTMEEHWKEEEKEMEKDKEKEYDSMEHKGSSTSRMIKGKMMVHPHEPMTNDPNATEHVVKKSKRARRMH